MDQLIRNQPVFDSGLYDARAVANYVLDNFDANKFDISNLKLNKILYFGHGHFLAKFKISLIKNHFEPWDYGPVVAVVYDEFKSFGSSIISGRAHYQDAVTGQRIIASHSKIAGHHASYLNLIVSRYAPVLAGALVKITHKPGSPWSQARARMFAGKFSVASRLRNDEISAYFEGK